MDFKHLVEVLQNRAAEMPLSTAYSFLDSKGELIADYSYRDIDRYARSFAALIAAKHLCGDRIAILLPTCVEFLIAFYGSIYAGMIPVPVSLPSRKNGIMHVSSIIADSQASACICTLADATWLSEALVEFAQLQILPISVDSLQLRQFEPLQPQESDIVFLQYTSGSTAKPKGVIISHKNVMANLQMIVEIFGNSKDSIVLGWTPLHHDMGLIGNVLQPLYVGCPAYLMDPVTVVQRPKVWLKTISEKKITATGGPNFIYEHCVKRVNLEKLSDLDLSSWVVAFNGAESIKAKAMKQFCEKFTSFGFSERALLPCYGMAEATLIICGCPHDEKPYLSRLIAANDSDQVNHSQQIGITEEISQKMLSGETFVSCGKPANGMIVRAISTKTSAELKPCEVGEIVIAGPSITQGYWHRPELNKKTFVTLAGETYLRTGDLGFIDQNDNIVITGRLKELVIVDGKNHYPQDIELTISASHLAFRDNYTAVFQVARETSDIVVAVQELERKFLNQLDPSELEGLEYKVKSIVSLTNNIGIDEVIFIKTNTIPQTTSGKIQRLKTKQQFIDNKLNRFEGVSNKALT
jgi:acyl-CoA synthetase (AMP-forming)/AMP-acid ligase II